MGAVDGLRGALAGAAAGMGRALVGRTDEPPPDLAAAIDGGHLMVREDDDKGPRIFFTWPGSSGSVRVGADAVRASILRRWPGLSDEQLNRAVKHIEARAKEALRRERERSPSGRRKNWALDLDRQPRIWD